MRLTHVGGPTVLAEVAGWRILTDPTFDPAGRRYTFGWGTASRKLAGPAVPAERLEPVDLVLLSHDQHADNLDDAGRALLSAAATVVTTRAAARRLRAGNVVGLDDWASTTVRRRGLPDLTVTATPARHGPPLSRPIVGAVNGFAVTVDGEPAAALWMSGDTVLYDGVRAVAERLRVDVALVHLGGVRFGMTGPLRFTMTGGQGAQLIAALAPRVAVPVHYEGWAHFREPETRLRRALDAPGVRDRIRWLPTGDAVDV
jgi:L-ascorbate metabolism protein UlaG (beta-lactamase superfamily)